MSVFTDSFSTPDTLAKSSGSFASSLPSLPTHLLPSRRPEAIGERVLGFTANPFAVGSAPFTVWFRGWSRQRMALRVAGVRDLDVFILGYLDSEQLLVASVRAIEWLQLQYRCFYSLFETVLSGWAKLVCLSLPNSTARNSITPCPSPSIAFLALTQIRQPASFPA